MLCDTAEGVWERTVNAIKWKIRGSLNWALLLNYIVFLILVCLFQPYFETNDDSAMRMTVSGAGGYYDSHLIYINILIGKLIVFLETHVPTGNWYTLIQLIIVFFSLCTVTYILIERSGIKYGSWISLILLTFFGYEGYIAVQFTKTAGFAAAAGMMLFVYAVTENSKNQELAYYMAAAALITIGSMMRFEMALTAIAVFAGSLFIEDVKNTWKSKGAPPKSVKWILLFIILVLIFGCKEYSKSCYTKEKDWRAFTEFNYFRSELLDYGFPDYAQNQSLYEEVGWTQEDLNFYKSWNIADSEKFQVETLKAVAHAKQKKRLHLQLIKDFFCEFMEHNAACTLFYIWLIFIVIFILGGSRKSGGIILYTSFTAIAFHLYLFWQGRYFIRRVDLAFLFIIVCCMFFHWRPIPVGEHAVILCTFVFLLVNSITYEGKHVEPETVREARVLIEALSEDEEHLYAAPMFHLRPDIAYGAYDSVPFGVMDNMISMGGWKTGSPLINHILDSYGVQNIYRDIVNNDRVYLLTYQANPESTLAYIQRHYAPNAYVTEEKRIGNYYIFAVHE